MAARFISLLACVAAAQAGIVGSPLGVPIGQAGLIGRAGLIGGGLIGQPGLIGSPLGVASPYGLGLGARSINGLPLGVSGLGLGARVGVNGLGLASPLIAQQAISPYGLAPQAISAYGLGARVAAPLGIAKTVVGAVDTDYDPNPSYSYAYDVQDALTGDSKNQQESRQGDVVQGSYSLVEPDGTRRTVEYTADPINGFNAVVHREPLAVAAVAKTVVAAPAVARLGYGAQIGVASPLGLASPLGVASPYGLGALGARTILG